MPFSLLNPVPARQDRRTRPWPRALTAIPHRNITHYSYFGSFRSDVSNVGPNAAMLDSDGQLTDIGSWYLGGDATGNIPTAGAAGKTVAASGLLSFAAVVVGLWLVL